MWRFRVTSAPRYIYIYIFFFFLSHADALNSSVTDRANLAAVQSSPLANICAISRSFMHDIITTWMCQSPNAICSLTIGIAAERRHTRPRTYSPAVISPRTSYMPSADTDSSWKTRQILTDRKCELVSGVLSLTAQLAKSV